MRYGTMKKLKEIQQKSTIVTEFLLTYHILMMYNSSMYMRVV